MTAGAAGGAGDHSTVTDVADAAPHLRLFQRRESSGEPSQPNYTVLMYATAALSFQRNLCIANILSQVPSHAWELTETSKMQAERPKNAQNGSKSVR